MNLKNKLYKKLVSDNEAVCAEYEGYKNRNLEYHKHHRIKSWLFLFRLRKASRKGLPLNTASYPKIKDQGVRHVAPSANLINSDHQKHFCDDTFDFIKSAWMTSGASDSIISRAYECINNQWYKQYGNSEIYLILIACLIETNRINEAEILLARYYALYGRKEIYRYLPVAKFASSLKYKANCNNSAFVYDRLKENNEKKIFAHLIKNATSIAIVGNSGREIGKKLGKQIDAHEIVIRFNNYPNNYQEDYGIKCNVWVRGGNKDIRDRSNIRNYKCVFWEPDFEHIKCQGKCIDILYRDVKSDPNKICNTDYSLKRSLMDISGLTNPSSGCIILWEIYNILGTFDKVDVYGFSFLDNNVKNFTHYYDNLCRFNLDHNVTSELIFLNNLYFNNKKHNISGALTVPDFKLTAKYDLPPILKDIEQYNKKAKTKIFICAYRIYDETTGKTGGPGGVLAMLKKLFGNMYKGIEVSYHFEKKGFLYPQNLHNAIDGLAIKVKNNFVASYYVQTNRELQTDLKSGIKPLFVCHDIGTAYGAYLCGCKYVLVYHQQGGIENEMRAINAEYDELDIRIINELERLVFENASKVFFPSLGAMDVFKKTSRTGQESNKINYSSTALYNTIPTLPRGVDYDGLLTKFKLPQIDRNTTDVFLSIGDYNYDKGMERIPQLLDKYVSKTHRHVLWISIGASSNKDIYNELIEQKEKHLFDSVIIGERTDHDSLFALIDYADYYIMLHHNSIFDLAILEAMQFGKAIILSDVGGNPEFNQDNNIVLVHDDDYDSAVNEIASRDKVCWGRENKRVFDAYFSNDCFIKEYAEMLDEQLDNMHYDGLKYKSETNMNTFTQFKNKYLGKTAVICGSGSSIDGYIPKRGEIHIALNRALFYNKVKFDYLFMQDYPINQPYTMDDYNAYPCIKFYGRILNSKHKEIGLKDEDIKLERDKYFRYELSPRVYVPKYDKFETDIDRYCLTDAQSVLFSALQFAVYAGFSKIKLIGVDFSNVNYSDVHNESKYAINVTKNLVQFKEQFGVDRQISLINTTNMWLMKQFGNQNNKITVTGIYTDSYKSVYEIQKQSCLDDYNFDFRYITDDEWKKAKTSSDFAFYGGNTIKTQLVIDKIKQYWGKVIIVADADVIFLRPTEEQILKELGNNDMLFLKERKDSINHPFEKTPLNINIGFVVIKCNNRSLAFWEKVQKDTAEMLGWDQEIANHVAESNDVGVKWNMLSDLFLNGGDMKKSNIKQLLITTACGTIAQKNNLPKSKYLSKVLNIVDGRDTRWFDGSRIEI